MKAEVDIFEILRLANTEHKDFGVFAAFLGSLSKRKDGLRIIEVQAVKVTIDAVTTKEDNRLDTEGN